MQRFRQEDRYIRSRVFTSTRYLQFTRVITSTVNFPRFGQLFTIPRPRFLDGEGCIFKDRMAVLILRIRHQSAQSVNQCPRVVIQSTSDHPCAPSLIQPLTRRLRVPSLVQINSHRTFTQVPMSMFNGRLSSRPSHFTYHHTALRDCLFRFFSRRRPFLILRLFTPKSNHFTSARLFFIRTEVKNIRRLMNQTNFQCHSFRFRVHTINEVFNIRTTIVSNSYHITLMTYHQSSLRPNTVIPITNIANRSQAINQYFLTSRSTYAAFEDISQSKMFSFLNPGTIPMASGCGGGSG